MGQRCLKLCLRNQYCVNGEFLALEEPNRYWQRNYFQLYGLWKRRLDQESPELQWGVRKNLAVWEEMSGLARQCRIKIYKRYLATCCTEQSSFCDLLESSCGGGGEIRKNLMSRPVPCSNSIFTVNVKQNWSNWLHITHAREKKG